MTAVGVAVFHLSPARGERSRASWRAAEGLPNTRTRGCSPSPGDVAVAPSSDLSPQAGRGEKRAPLAVRNRAPGGMTGRGITQPARAARYTSSSPSASPTGSTAADGIAKVR